MSIKADLKALVVKLNLLPLAKRLYTGLTYPQLVMARLRIRKALGADAWKQISGKRVVSHPNRINRPFSILMQGYALEKILMVLPVRVASFHPWDSPAPNVYVNWQDLTVDESPFASYLEQSLAYTNKSDEFSRAVLVNARCNDISKLKVAASFAQTFGYPLDVDPLTYKAKMVVKSDANGLHDGRVVDGPIEPEAIEEGAVYNVAIDNSVNGDSVVDFRLPVVGSVADFCYKKRRPLHSRFSNTNESTIMLAAKDVFSADELSDIAEFCKTMGLDYGELDCLRDAVTQKLYVIDVAKTPSGPPNGISNADRISAIEKMAVLFARNFLQKS